MQRRIAEQCKKRNSIVAGPNGGEFFQVSAPIATVACAPSRIVVKEKRGRAPHAASSAGRANYTD